ncbi:MAG: hypothetical protein KDD37_08800 [Bdellovibrionales bacterium]|nr:hypothetical protein [Bdellovibrionales bacterium]
MKFLTLILSLFSFTAHAKTVKVYCQPDGTNAVSFTLAASLEIDEETSNTTTDLLVSFKDNESDTPSQIINTKGYHRNILDETSYTYLFPLSKKSMIVHFILRLNTDQASEVETVMSKKYLSHCSIVD